MENFENRTNSTMDDFSVKDSLDTLISNFDKAFLVMMGILIIFMQAGFGFLEAGSIRAKNATCNFAPVIWTEVVLILQSHPDRNDF